MILFLHTQIYLLLLHDIVFQAFDKCLENTARPEVILELLQEDETT